MQNTVSRNSREILASTWTSLYQTQTYRAHEHQTAVLQKNVKHIHVLCNKILIISRKTAHEFLQQPITFGGGRKYPNTVLTAILQVNLDWPVAPWLCAVLKLVILQVHWCSVIPVTKTTASVHWRIHRQVFAGNRMSGQTPKPQCQCNEKRKQLKIFQYQ